MSEPATAPLWGSIPVYDRPTLFSSLSHAFFYGAPEKCRRGKARRKTPPRRVRERESEWDSGRTPEKIANGKIWYGLQHSEGKRRSVLSAGCVFASVRETTKKIAPGTPYKWHVTTPKIKLDVIFIFLSFSSSGKLLYFGRKKWSILKITLEMIDEKRRIQMEPHRSRPYHETV